MNIGFYGKGGSGKTTLAALFALYLDDENHTVGLLDADVNSHTAEVIGASIDKDRVLSLKENENKIWQYLAGSNHRVKPTEYLNTTPPGAGSNYWSMDKNNHLTQQYGQGFGKSSHVFTVGSYKSDAVGTACHHSTQTVAENMISHAKFNEDDILVIDSVAGNDAFGTTLYLNDLLVFIVKPEREGINVLHRFLELAEHAGVADKVVVIGNQATTETQRQFIEREVPAGKLIGIFGSNETIIDTRLDDKSLNLGCISSVERDVFHKVLNHANSQRNTAMNHDGLVSLHKKVSAESWVAGSYRAGLQDQIDPNYQPV